MLTISVQPQSPQWSLTRFFDGNPSGMAPGPKPRWSQLQQSEHSDKDFYTENLSVVWTVANYPHGTYVSAGS